METAFWIALPFVVAAGTALMSWMLLQSRMEVAVAREREAHAKTRAALTSFEDTLEDKLRLAEETAKRKALDHFLTGFRVEERRYLRERCDKPSVVLQERLFFRNIPLSSWVEHELLLENGNLQQIESASVFTARHLGEFASTGNVAPRYLAH